MKLLQSEVLIVPGRSAQYTQGASVVEGQAVPGAAIVRLTNTTPRENAFKVRVRCSDPYWQENWVRPIALPPGPEGITGGKADQRGPQGKWVKVYVPRDSSRDILLRFQAPQAPDSRAGRYPFVVEIETQILGMGDGSTRRSHMTELAGTAYIAPFYKWSLDLSPPQQTVGMVKHSDDFAVVVTNESNDWLYCDLEVPRPTNMLLEAPTLRVALPPPEPGELLPTALRETPRVGTQRSVPLRATSQLRNIGGLTTLQPIDLIAKRVDAPSVALPSGYSGHSSVVAQETTEQEQVPGNRGLMYRPPIPSAVSMLYDRTGNAFRSVIATFVGLGVLVLAIAVCEENYRFSGISVKPLLKDFNINTGDNLQFDGVEVDDAKVTMGGIPVKAEPIATGGTRYRFRVPAELDKRVAKLKAQRSLRYLPFLDSLLPSYESPVEIRVNLPPEDKPNKNANPHTNSVVKASSTTTGEDGTTGNSTGGTTGNSTGGTTAGGGTTGTNNTVTTTTGTSNGGTNGTLPGPTAGQASGSPAGTSSPSPSLKPTPPTDSGVPFPKLLQLFNEVVPTPSDKMRDAAETLLQTASHLTPGDTKQNSLAWAIQGYLQIQLGQEEKGAKGLKTAIALQPDNFLAHTGKGLLYYQQAIKPDCGDKPAKLKQAIGELQVAVSYSDSALPYFLLARAYWQLQTMDDKALEEATKATSAERAPKIPAAFQLLGQIYARLGKNTEAKAAYDTAKSLDSTLPNLEEDIKKLNGNY